MLEEVDKDLVQRYGPKDHVSGKRKNKQALQKALGLIQDDNGPLFSSDKPMSVSVSESGVLTLRYSAGNGAKVTMRLSEKPKMVSLDGERYRGWDYNRKTGLTIDIPKGSGEIAIR